MKGNWANIVALTAIVVVSALAGTLVDWRAPGIDQYAHDWLMRARGPLPAPDDIAIVAIDEPSIVRFGRFPWPRALTARAIDAIAAAQPKAIALDVLYTDPATEADDNALARSVQQAGNVVVAAQLVGSPITGGPTRWLLPLPGLQRAAAAVGHVNVSTESDGIARQILIRAADDQGRAIRAMAVETIRIGDGIPEQSLTETAHSLLLGTRVIPVESAAPGVVVTAAPGVTSSTQTFRASRIAIDYIGPAGSFRAYSFADVADGRVLPAEFRGKYVAVGATAASLGDRLASPFLHREDQRADQNGSLMPGVEVLANTLNTILRSRFYSETPDWLAFLCNALAAGLILFLLALAEGRYETVKQIGVLAAVAGGILWAGYVAFTRWLVFPPVAPALVSFASAGMLGLLRRSLAASSRLDASIAEITRAGESLGPMGSTPEPPRWWWPQGLAWKARALGQLNRRIVERARFVDLAMRSVEDALIIADLEGRITFANRRAAAVLDSSEEALRGRDLLQRLAEAEQSSPETGRDVLARLVAGRARIEREFTIPGARPRHFTLRLAAVSSGENGHGIVLGIVASLSDITRQQELQKTKNDVMALVSHEMRTPLTAIQGMSELLSQFEVDPERRKEMNLAIHDEAKRLTSMISEYLDITRLESGATVLRRSPVRVEALLERVLLMLDPLAAQRGIRLTRRFDPGLHPLLADADLLSRAIANLVSNAIKYSPPQTEVVISAKSAANGIAIEVADQGYGISEADTARVFEKFYRVPRVQDADVPGTGLGLALVREVAELHHGSVVVRSSMGAGSVFTLWIPYSEG